MEKQVAGFENSVELTRINRLAGPNPNRLSKRAFCPNSLHFLSRTNGSEHTQIFHHEIVRKIGAC